MRFHLWKKGRLSKLQKRQQLLDVHKGEFESTPPQGTAPVAAAVAAAAAAAAADSAKKGCSMVAAAAAAATPAAAEAAAPMETPAAGAGQVRKWPSRAQLKASKAAKSGAGAEKSSRGGSARGARGN